MHLEQYSTLSPSAQRELDYKLSQAEEREDVKEQALINCGIYSIEAAITAYVKKYAKTKKIKDLVESFQEVLDSTQVLAKAKDKVATDEEAAKACAERAAAVKEKIDNGKEAEIFKEKIAALNPIETIESKAEMLKAEAARKTSQESGLVWIVIAIVLTCIPKTRKCGLTMIIAMAITYLVGNLFLKNVIARPRPCAVDTGVTLKIPFPSEYSFPSGHTSNGFAGAVTIFSYYRKAGILSLLMAAVIAFSRLYFFVHYPTDILGGMVLGTLDAVLAVYIVKRLEDRADAKTVSDNDKTGHR